MNKKLITLLSIVITVSCIGAFSSGAVTSKKNLTAEKVKSIQAKPSIKAMAIGAYKAMEALKCNPQEQCSVWDQNYLKRDSEVKNLLIKYLEGDYGHKVKNLHLAKKTKVEIIETLVHEGFTLKVNTDDIDNILGNTKDSQLQDSGEIYVHNDGSIVRIKDSSIIRRIRPQAYIVKAVLKNPNGSTDWSNEAFKVNEEGAPIPKGPKQILGLRTHAPSSTSAAEDKGWIDLIMEEAHIDILPSNNPAL